MDSTACNEGLRLALVPRGAKRFSRALAGLADRGGGPLQEAAPGFSPEPQHPSGGAPQAVVLCALGSEEWGVPVAPGTERWGAVAQVVDQTMRCGVRVDEPPVYDSGTRSRTLTVALVGRWHGQVLSGPVR